MIVQKFGGSSLASDELRRIAVDRVAQAVARGYRPVVVVSALGRHPSPYATDSLAALLEAGPHDANADLLLACGELISAGIFARLLGARGLRAMALGGAQAGIVTDEHHGDATILEIDAQRILRVVRDGAIPVVAGFQGATRSGSVTTIGRGGSDLTAVAIACALGGVPLEIYTDVDGVCTADPHVVPSARTLERLSAEELVRLARNGARVMQSKAAELAHRTGTSLRILGLRSGIGTFIQG